MSEAVQALRNILEAQPRLASIMASQPALEPIFNCIHPICRSGPRSYTMSGTFSLRTAAYF